MAGQPTIPNRTLRLLRRRGIPHSRPYRPPWGRGKRADVRNEAADVGDGAAVAAATGNDADDPSDLL